MRKSPVLRLSESLITNDDADEEKFPSSVLIFIPFLARFVFFLFLSAQSFPIHENVIEFDNFKRNFWFFFDKV